MPGISLRLPQIEPICGQVHPTAKRDGPARYWPALILRVSCFLAIALGILSLLSVWTGQTGGAIAVLWVSPEQALGLIFVGFAVRMSRLEAHSRSVRAVVQTSRICLIIVGASLTAGGHAVGICYFAIGLSLVCKQRLPHFRVDAVLTALVCTFLSSCWISLLLSRMAMSPVPSLLRVDLIPLAILTAIAYILSTATRAPGVLRVLAQHGPEAEAARVMFPLAFLIPVLLAILRHQAQSAGLLQPDLGLLLHVLMSAGSMFAMIVWNANRIHSAQRIRESTGVVVAEMETQYRDIFAVLRDPVWVFSAEGELEYENGAARQFMASNGEAGLGVGQQRAVLSAAMLGRRVKLLELLDRETFAPRSLAIQYLRVLLTPQGEPGTIILVAHVLPPQDPQPLQSLLDAATERTHSPSAPVSPEPAP